MRYIKKLIICMLSVCLLFGITRLFAETPPPDYHFQVAVKQYLEGDNEAALVSLKKSLEVNPDNRETLELINLISGKKKIETPVFLPEVSIQPVSTKETEIQNKKTERNEPYRDRLEASISEEYLNPHDAYGDWKTLSIAFYRKQSDSLTYFLQGGFFWRDDGNGVLGGGGLYKTWSPFLYTYSALSAGSSVGYLPELRIDHSFNFKLGQKRNNVLPIEFTYIGSHTGHEDYIISSGIVAYRSNWVYEYKISRNQSEPGGVISYSNLISILYGQEGVQWLGLTMSAGKQAYLATSLTIPEAVNQNSFYAVISCRHWLAKNYGITGDLSYFKLDRGYDKYGLSLGVFTEF